MNHLSCSLLFTIAYLQDNLAFINDTLTRTPPGSLGRGMWLIPQEGKESLVWVVVDCCIWLLRWLLAWILQGTWGTKGMSVKKTYKRSPEEANVRYHGPEDGGQIRYVEECCSVALDEPGNDRVSKKVKSHKPYVECCYLAAWMAFKLLVFLKDDKWLKKTRQGPKQT